MMDGTVEHGHCSSLRSGKPQAVCQEHKRLAYDNKNLLVIHQGR